MSQVRQSNNVDVSVKDNAEGAQAQQDGRKAKRVEVGLRVAIVLGKDTAYMARTQNFSETGILVTDYTGPHLADNRLVGVNIRGLITDESTGDDPNQYLMRVVRQEGSEVALRFVGEID